MTNTNINDPWTGPRLMVPLTLEGLVVTNANNGTEFAVHPLQLGMYEDFGNISPNLFSANQQQPSCGVHLNWALPDALTQGIHDKDTGQVLYPYVPNRWLVVRFSADPKVPGKAWIVESDGAADTTNGEIQGQLLTKDADGSPSVTYIGKQYDFSTWTETGQNSELILTAIGNSDPLFAAYAGNNPLVFSFTDSLSDVTPTVAKPVVSYMVCGWYSNTIYDILYSNPPAPKDGCGIKQGWASTQDWLNTMTQLQWSVGSEAIAQNPDLTKAIAAAKTWLGDNGYTPPVGLPGELCGQMLCHGALLDVEWPGNNVQPDSNVPVYNTGPSTAPYVSSANTATDCLAAFMQWQLNYNNPTKDPADAEVEIMLEAFAQKMLPQPGGKLNTPELMNAIHNSWFGKMPGGTEWVAQKPPKSGNPSVATTDRVPTLLPPALAQGLANLNQLQATYDKQFRVLLTQQKQLYADWMKYNMFEKMFIQPTSVTQAQLNTAMLNSLQVAQAQITVVAKQQQTVATAQAALQEQLTAAGYQELVSKPLGNFYTPGDPVFMVNNTGRSYKRGEDLIYSQDNDFLFVRFTGQFVTELQVSTTAGSTIVKGTDIAPTFNWNTGQPMPKDIPDLFAEACLFDTYFANAIAAKAGAGSSVNTIQQQQTLIWNKQTDINGLYNASLDTRTLEKISGFNPGDNNFHVPSKIGVWQWEQPWNPIYLEWKVTYFPGVEPTLSQWQFNGSDYEWTGGTYPPITPPLTNGVIYKGRSILTAKQATTLQKQLQEFINSYQGQLPSDYIPLQDVITGMGNWDVLSQTITGFSLQLIQWDIEQFGYQPIDNTYNAAVGTEAHGVPMCGEDTTEVSFFYPVRGGFVNILQLWIVDDFGQVYNINPSHSSGVPANPMPPIPGIGMEPGNYDIQLNLPTCFQLPPRIVQGSRLNFNFVSATNDKVLSTQVPGTTPVCGWVVPNHQDNSAMVYDNTGILLGELMMMGATGNAHAQWVPAPISGSSAANISNTHLNKFVQGLLGNTGSDTGSTPWSGLALANFLKSIDETLWTVDPLGEREDQNLSILIGRPIAVLRASLDLELYGSPANDLSWGNTGQQQTGQIDQYEFPIRIGSVELNKDGVMGYFANDNYSTFNSVHNNNVVTPASPPYVVNEFTELSFLQPSPEYITLLLDPRGSIHCSTGFLPVLEVPLPEYYVGDALNNMLVEFKSGPLLMDESTWRIPLPAVTGSKWSWLNPQQQQVETTWSEITDLVTSDAIAQLNVTPPQIKEGRLKLAGALGSQLMIFFFEVNGMQKPYTVKTGSTIQLSWTAQGGVSATLSIGSAPSVNVDTSNPAYAYTVTASVTMILQVNDNAGNSQSMSLTITAN